MLMNLTFFTLVILILISIMGYQLGKNRSLQSRIIGQTLLGLPKHYGMYTCIYTFLPGFFLFTLWSLISPNIIDSLVLESIDPERLPNEESLKILLLDSIKSAANGGMIATNVSQDSIKSFVDYSKTSNLFRLTSSIFFSVCGFLWAYKKIEPTLKAKDNVESLILSLFFLSSIIAIITTLGIILSLLFETGVFFKSISPNDFFFGTLWSPQIALREGQVAAEGSFGAIPVFAGTLLVTIIAMIIAGPIGLMTAIYLAEYADPLSRKFVKPAIEILAGIPTVVYGFFAALIVGPFVRDIGNKLGLEVSSESALAAGLVMGIMIIPFVSSLSDDVINAVPQSLREASFGIGATKSETIVNVIIPAALPGIVGAFLLAISRAIGETMIVVMAAGLSAKLTANPLESVTTVTVQIVTLLIGDHEFDSTKTRAAFALGMTLFTVTLILNVFALRIVQKYREQYE